MSKKSRNKSVTLPAHLHLVLCATSLCLRNSTASSSRIPAEIREHRASSLKPLCNTESFLVLQGPGSSLLNSPLI